MFNQDLDIADVSSERRNPILANVMTQLDYMENKAMDLHASAMRQGVGRIQG